MCILCVIQKWSRRVATMLPLLVFPLIGLWALSQLLPPAFRFEITSPRLACVLVLLFTLFWYEILMPKLSAWRARRNAWLRERKRNEAIELQKLRKTATRKCRNCLTPYRDQKPGGGKFMCSYCGHISKRPVLELPVPPGMGNSGIFKDLVGKGGKLLNGKAWSNNGWMCNQDWQDGGTWPAGSFASKPANWQKNGNCLFGGDESCFAENSYSGIVIFAHKLLTSFFMSIRWLWRKIFRTSSSGGDPSLNEHGGMLNSGDCEENFPESKSEKARRKAEEKRQARLERELLEEEERKQREEVSRLVEERRKLKGEKSSTEKDSEKIVSPVKDNHRKNEAEKKRRERRKDRDMGSSKSNSDAEELERRAVSKENDRRHESDKKSEADSGEYQKSVIDSMKGPNADSTHGSKNFSGTSVNRGSAGARYLDRMRGTWISSSKALSGTGFFGRTSSTSTVMLKETKPINAVNHPPTSAPKRDLCPTENVARKSAANVVPIGPQPIPAPKKSWQQLFTRSTPAHQASNPNVISRPNTKMRADVPSPSLPAQAFSAQSFDRPISFGMPSSFPYPLQNVTPSNSLGFLPAIEPMFPRLGERLHENIPEETELFEDPCYVPDPASLLGPVSESLDNFQLDTGSGFISDMGLERHRMLKISTVASEISRSSPMESPISRPRVVDDKHSHSNRLPITPKSQERQSSPVQDARVNDDKTWQLWGPSPHIDVSAWHLNPDRARLNKEEVVRPSTQRTMASLFTKEDPVLPNTYSPQKDFLGSGPNAGAFSATANSKDKDPWLQQAFSPPLPEKEKHFSFKPQESPAQNAIFFGVPARTTSAHPFEPSPSKTWSNEQWAVLDPGELVGNQYVTMPQVSELFPPQMYSHFGTENGK